MSDSKKEYDLNIRGIGSVFIVPVNGMHLPYSSDGVPIKHNIWTRVTQNLNEFPVVIMKNICRLVENEEHMRLIIEKEKGLN